MNKKKTTSPANKSKQQEVIMTIGAHNDDYIIGAGGTIAKYLAEGKRVIHIIFSYGELGNILVKKELVRKTRFRESLDADAVLGGKDIIYLDLPETKFLEEFDKKKSFMIKVLEKYKPTRIFTHAKDDPHPDHQAVYKIVMEITSDLQWKPEVYTFDVWNLLNLKKRMNIKLIVDITPTFKKKVAAFKLHKSQKLVIFLHLWSIYLKARIAGFSHETKYAEIFYKER
ncbi:MAG: PIG-L deacetylase family protein [Candidatus Woesearchaeota archaeon]